MATLEELEARVAALEQAQEQAPAEYYTSKYSGEELDALLDKIAAMAGAGRLSREEAEQVYGAENAG